MRLNVQTDTCSERLQETPNTLVTVVFVVFVVFFFFKWLSTLLGRVILEKRRRKKTAGRPITAHYTLNNLIRQMNLTFEFCISAITPAEIAYI